MDAISIDAGVHLAGCPAQAFGFYPTDHEGAADILKAL